ncbi:MAG: hypothetical protein ACKVQR_20765 [Aquabacterium sp.]
MLSSHGARRVAPGVVLLCLAWAPVVRSSPGSTELEIACPGARAQLTQQLAGAWSDREVEGVVRVRLAVDGEGITQVVVRDLRGDYRDPVRKAVRSLHCRVSGGLVARVEFDIVFLPPDGAGTAHAPR